MNHYELLGVTPWADLAEITSAYLRISRDLSAVKDGDGAAPNAARLEQVEAAYDVLSNPSRRSAYDAQLGVQGRLSYVEADAENRKWSPIRRLLTIIASLMAIGMVIQISVMLVAYKRASSAAGIDAGSPAAEKAYLQEFYLTYGIRAASKAEADLLLAEMRRKEEAAREEKREELARAEDERKLRQFEEESRRIGAQVSENLQRAEREAERAREEEIRRKEEKERAVKEAEKAKLEREINRWRSRPSSNDE
jgi:curved DNA-binding protein CbpA